MFLCAVAYTVADEFAYAANCHCDNCRRTTGAAFKPFAGISRPISVMCARRDGFPIPGTLSNMPENLQRLKRSGGAGDERYLVEDSIENKGFRSPLRILLDEMLDAMLDVSWPSR